MALRPGLVSGGRGADAPLARACSGGKGGAGREADPASWNLGRLGAKARGGGVSQQKFTRMRWNVMGTARLARWSSPDSVLCFRGQLQGEQGAGPRDGSWLQPPRLPTPSPTQNHRAPSSWAGAQNHRASVPPRCGGRASVLRPQAPTPSVAPLAPPGPQAHAWTRQDSASFTVPRCFTPTHLHRRQHRAPDWAPKFIVLASFLPSLIHSSFIQTIQFWARHSAGLGGAAKSKEAREPPQGAHGLSRKCLALLQTAV